MLEIILAGSLIVLPITTFLISAIKGYLLMQDYGMDANTKLHFFASSLSVFILILFVEVVLPTRGVLI